MTLIPDTLGLFGRFSGSGSMVRWRLLQEYPRIEVA